MIEVTSLEEADARSRTVDVHGQSYLLQEFVGAAPLRGTYVDGNESNDNQRPQGFLVTQPPGWISRDVRGFDLVRAIEAVSAESPNGRVNLICYAVGGLDCRYVVSPGGLYAEDEAARLALVARVASITTIATPHRGTTVADAALYLSDEVLGVLLGQRAAGGRDDPEVVRALEELSPENAGANLR